MKPRSLSVEPHELADPLTQVADRAETAAARGSTKLFAKHMQRLVLLGYAAGVDLSELRSQTQMAVKARLDHGSGWTADLIAMARLFGLADSEMVAIRDAVGSKGNSVADFLLWERPTWLQVGYPTNDWQREACEFVDQILEDPSSGPAVLQEFFQAWKDEERPEWISMSFEIAAVAQICGIDDSALAEAEFYPYELAHFLDQ